MLFRFVYYPWQLNWGATDEEIKRNMVGDEIVKNPTFHATRTVTINASPEDIWPWLVQIGYKKAGFYSWDILDNDGIPSAERIMPEYQDLKVGDLIPMDKDSFGKVAALEPNKRMLVVFQPETKLTWSWGLYEIDDRQTRLVSRLRWRPESTVMKLILDAVEIIMMRKHLLGIKRRAEALALQSRD